MFIAAYSESFYSKENIVLKYLHFPFAFLKYIFNVDVLTKRLVDIFENAEVPFLKALLLELESKLFHLYHEFIEHDVPINRMFHIPPAPLKIFSDTKGEMVDIPIPSCHIGVKPIACRILSARQRKGMVNKIRNTFKRIRFIKSFISQINVNTMNDAAPLSKYLIIHVHGGEYLRIFLT